MQRVVVTGDDLGERRAFGGGVYEARGRLWASVSGDLVETPVPSVRPRRPVPAVDKGSVVLGRVTRLDITKAFLDVLAVDGVVTDAPLRAALRREDVFRESVDPATVDLRTVFKGGDIIAARVINTADDNLRYTVSTADHAMGKLTLSLTPGGESTP